MKSLSVRILGALVILPLAISSSALAQGSETLRERTRGKVAHIAGPVHWSKQSDSLWYQADLGHDRHEIVRVLLPKGERQRAFDHETLARFLTEKLDRPIEAERLPVEQLEVSDDGSLRILAFGRNWLLDEASGDWKRGNRPPPNPHRHRNPRLDDDLGATAPGRLNRPRWIRPTDAGQPLFAIIMCSCETKKRTRHFRFLPKEPGSTVMNPGFSGRPTRRNCWRFGPLRETSLASI